MSFEVHQVPAAGAEDVVVAADGVVFTGTEDGSIFRIRHDGQRIDRVAHTGGRPLGIETLLDGRLLVCDAKRGLLKIDPASGAIESTVDAVGGQKLMFCNNAAVHGDGSVWFSDSSTLYPLEKWKNDLVENTRTGRLLKLSEDGTLTVALDRLAFANGVALARDESYVAVAETGARTVVRLWLTGPKSGTRDFLVDDLPGYPDNIARGSDGLIWVTIASPTDPVVERLQTAPMTIRKAVTRIPDKLQPKPKRTIRVQAYDDAGRVVHDLDVHDDRFHMVTGVREHEGRVWMGSLHEPAVAVLTL
jgi:sugar lactone lactonase YvrE